VGVEGRLIAQDGDARLVQAFGRQDVGDPPHFQNLGRRAERGKDESGENEKQAGSWHGLYQVLVDEVDQEIGRPGRQSGAGDGERSRRAMEAVDRLLVRREHGLIQLLDPPFDKSDLDPGYIKGYVPGVRENGGQYTHAAVWTAMAFAALGDSSRAWDLLAMINPINHARSPEEIAIYKGEPYVAAADVYAVSPHIGRGGWTWYTGSAGWMYRLIVESLLGLRLATDKLRFEPCLPKEWDAFKVHYRYRETIYHITVRQMRDNSAASVTVDGVEQGDKTISLVDDRQEHAVEVKIAAR
jgi:cellobiose phosphorylase